jgi:hypothetical protein
LIAARARGGDLHGAFGGIQTTRNLASLREACRGSGAKRAGNPAFAP